MPLSWNHATRRLELPDGTPVGTATSDIEFTIRLEEVRDVSLREWYQALREDPGRRYIAYVHDDDDLVIIDPLKADDGQIEFSLSATGPAWNVERVQEMMRLLCQAKGDRLDAVGYDYDAWVFNIHCTPDERTTADLYAFGDVCRKLFGLPEAPNPGRALEAGAIRDFLLAGAPHALIGLSESHFLEVKSYGYNLDSFPGEVELAQDVASFANGEHAAILAIGFRTRRENGGDVVSKVVRLALPDNSVARYREVISRRVYPAIQGLEVDLIRIEPGSILSILIPEQSESSKPFIVHGAVLGDKNAGSILSIVRRRDENSSAMTAPELHALLSAGRAVLRRATE